MLVKTALSLALLATSAVAQQGEWKVIGNSGVVCIHMIQLPNGKLLCIERPREFPYTFNPNTKGRTVAEITLLGEAPDDGPANLTTTATFGNPSIWENSFCGHHVQRGDGSIMVVGGDPRQLLETADGTIMIANDNPAVTPEIYNSSNVFLTAGGKGIRIYHPCADGDFQCAKGTWDKDTSMTTNRWYPTVVTLANGDQIIIGGSDHNIDMDHPDPEHNSNPTYEYYPPKPDNGLAWPRQLPILAWAFPHSLYPQAFLLPSGKVWLHVSNRTNIIDPDEDATAASVVNGAPKAKSAGNIPDTTVVADHSPWIYPHSPASVVLPMTIKNGWNFKVQLCGGSKSPASATAAGHNAGAVTDGAIPRTPASADCIVINPEDANPQWSVVDSMPSPKLMVDNILLPDGKILYTNGASWGQAGGNGGQAQYAYPVNYDTFIYDPEAPKGSQWSTMAPATVPRLYHSGLILLPTGHVITAGSEMNNFGDYWPTANMNCFPANPNATCSDPFETRIERFTPPYLQTSVARPVIKTAPKSLTYKSTFKVDMSTDGTLVDRVTFIRYSTSTHQLNTDQRFYELVILGKTKDALYLQAPPAGGIAPPGNWMLWALTMEGVPSVAKTVLLQNGDATSVDVPTTAQPGNGDQNTSSKTPGKSDASRGKNVLVAGVIGLAGALLAAIL